MTATGEVPGSGQPFICRRLLVPLDGSMLAEAALPLAEGLARAFAAPLLLLHIVERDARPTVHGEPHLVDAAAAREYLGGIAMDLAARGVSVVHEAHERPEGDVARSIAAHAQEQGCDLIVLCGHGRGGLRDTLWGHIAEQVLAFGPVPVVVVRAGDRRTSVAPAGFAPGTILVPLDGTVEGEAALVPAAAIARRTEARLHLALVVPTVETMPRERRAAAMLLPGATRALLEIEGERAAAYLDGLAARWSGEGVAVETEVRRGDAVTELLEETGEHAIGLIALATHGTTGLPALWRGSTGARLLRRAGVPLLLVRIG